MPHAKTVRKPDIDIDPDIAAARKYAREVKIACDELHDDPFGLAPRARLLTLIVEASVEADESWARLMAENGSSL
jgi:hypothetical protein